jgi:hypothetical protein
LGINLTKEMKDLCNEYYKNSGERNYRGHKNRKISHVHGSEESILLRLS